MDQASLQGQAVCMQVLASVLFLRLHPKPLKHTPSYEFSASFLGVCAGIVVAVSRMAQRYKRVQPGGFLYLLRLEHGWQVVLRMMLGERACCYCGVSCASGQASLHWPLDSFVFWARAGTLL